MSLYRFFALPLRLQGLLLQTWCLLLWFYFRLKTANFSLYEMRERSSYSPIKYSGEEAVWSIGVFTRRIVALQNCLVVSLTLQYLLAAIAIQSRVKIGVRHHKDLEAHAWLELENGEVIDLLSDSSGDFTPLLGGGMY